ncbi:hypothetical protein GA0074692_6450 [Micromonospora pallida]|uniref:Uncharacterized protein n=1 Tax=Micromonospora pallida TaxID=145854 RepID=A0A1C6TIW4_9ACTN|nr:hypothetical protein GA0074692_6450 [Micromonospora pallida]
MKLASLMLAISLVGATVGAPAAGAAVSPSESQVGVSAICEFIVVTDGAPVRKSPYTTATILKRKNLGDRVTGNCDWTRDSDGNYWDSVYCSCAASGIAWMRSKNLRPDL